MALCIVLTGTGQLFLKLGATDKKGLRSMFLNAYTMLGYLMILLVTIFSVLALRTISLKLLYTLMAMNYVILLLLSRAVLKEPITPNKIFATMLVFAGVIVFNI